ncbi:hypothetical protein AKJ52_01930 [candidate division MSBL1 archaeon SCGC-AAA382C18]|uniref:MJ1316 RNA cyclic group end recognition domain-containing protein n=1 Tax=candidate division MSBL1 archaeon SCGC-AAA382C18 TaxID=1698281 RepID=A0A133VJL1_9EURY|nr:hypothetical protein AKJ52_01930 [candidate division MSBL1 archaeon SCGC-AAA382C18]
MKWHPDYNLKNAKITIINRGSPRDRMSFSGEEIQDLGSGFMTIARDNRDVKIPYHRITRIETPEEILWKEQD